MMPTAGIEHATKKQRGPRGGLRAYAPFSSCDGHGPGRSPFALTNWVIAPVDDIQRFGVKHIPGVRIRCSGFSLA